MLGNKTILVTGGTGSIGSHLTNTILNQFNVNKLKLVSNNISELAKHREEINNDKLEYHNIDIRDLYKINRVCEDVDIIIHLAAFKFTPQAEFFRDDTYTVNVDGTNNLINCSLANGVDKFLFISSDKAVNPINFYGKTKRVGEILTQQVNEYSDTTFSVLRFGNVLDTDGSVIQIIKEQISNNKPITITNQDMTRLYMSKKEASEFIIDCVDIVKGGEILIRDVPRIRTGDLIYSILESYNVVLPMTNIGFRIGEKMDEDLIYELEKSHISRVFKDIYKITDKQGDTNLDNPVYNRKQTSNFLKDRGIIC